MEREKRHIGLAVNKTSKLIHRYMGRIAAIKYADEMTGTHAWILNYLYSHKDEAIFQRDIEKKLGIRRSSATGLLQMMERNGLIYREPVPYDARLKRIVMTEAAISLRDSIEKEIDAFERQISRGFSQEELDQLFYLLEKVRNNLNEENEVTV